MSLPSLSGPWTSILAAILGFLLGSIPFGVLVLKACGAPDPRTIGSGNIGATNVTRAGGKGLGALTLLLDAGKGLLACVLFGPTVAGAVAGTAAVLGHCFTPWLSFRGGKGVATFLGISLVGGVLAPGIFVLAWVLAFAAWRVSALAGVSACAVTAVAACLRAGLQPEPAALAGAIALGACAAVVIVRHRSNFEDLLRKRRLGPAGGPKP